MLLRSSEQLAAAEQQVGFPAVLKPISGAASLGAPRWWNSLFSSEIALGSSIFWSFLEWKELLKELLFVCLLVDGALLLAPLSPTTF